mgnify:CR=1 FL=1
MLVLAFIAFAFGRSIVTSNIDPSIFVLIGISSLAYRRFIIKPKYLGDKTSYTSGFVALFISVLMITYIIEYISVSRRPDSRTFFKDKK